MKKPLLYLALALFVAFVAVAVFGQGGVGPSGKAFYDYSQKIVVLPQGYDYTYNTAYTGTVVTDASNIYVFNAATGKWNHVAMVTPTNTPTPTASSTSTSTPTATATPTVSP